MFLRLVTDSFTRRPRRKLITLAALALGMAVVTAALSVSLNIGDKLAEEFRSLGANLVVTPQADSLPLEIGGVDYRAANAGAFLPEAELGKLKTIFWRHNIKGFAPILEAQVKVTPYAMDNLPDTRTWPAVPVIGTWVNHEVKIPDGTTYSTGVEKTNPWWQLKDGRWFAEGKNECVIGKNFAKKNGLPEATASPGKPLKRTALEPGNQLFTYTLSGKPGPALDIVGVLDAGGPEDDAIVVPIDVAQKLADEPGMYRRLYVSALTKPEDAFGRKDPKAMSAAEYDRWYCSPYISSIALQIGEVLKGTDVRVIRRVAEGEGNVLRRVRTLLWLVTLVALLASGLAVGASAAASVIERRGEIGLMKALGAGSGLVGVLLAAEQLLVAFVGGGIGYALGILLARMLGEKVFGFTPEPKLFVLLIVLLLAAAVTLLGSAMPLRRASRLEPAPILRGE
jgi:putative ABC transport system permease protein